MKRHLLFLLGATAGLTSLAGAQGLTMQMSNGWRFTFSGNVNAFAVYSADANGGQKNFNIRTGLLPGFAVFDAKGTEEGLNLGVHVGFAPQINNAGQVHDGLAQIDMRQLYLTVGFKNGSQLLAGRELGVFMRQNIVNDMTLYGTGALGGVQDGGTTLGRIGYGYIYPNFNAQITYSTAPGKSWQLVAGAFQPSVMGGGGFDQVQLPRLEAEVTISPQMSGKNKLMVWGGLLWQTAKDAPSGGNSVTATGVTAGGRIGMGSGLGLTVAAYTGSGLGTVLFFNSGDDLTGIDENKSDGGYAQVTYTMGKTTLGGSYGISRLRDNNSNFIGQFSSYTVGWYHQWTKSLKLVAEGTREVNDLGGGIGTLGAGPNRTVVSGGLMLFF
jgi:hypothetical protein